MSNPNPRHRVSDRISGLPDQGLVDILSSFPTRFAGKTSILSKRWKSVWTSVPSLIFEDAPATFSLSTQDRKTRFLRFVNNVLQENNSLSIHKYRLHTACISNELESEVVSWITNAIDRKVREIDVCLPCVYFDFPRITFTSKTLTVLKLDGAMTIRVPTSASLPNLKTMVLRLVRYHDSKSASNLLNCCPKLENLSFFRIEFRDKTKRFCIDARKLKFLEIDLDFHPIFLQIEEYDINAPALEYLDIKDYGSSSMRLTNVGCLKKANICVGKSFSRRSFLECSHAFRNIEFLSLSYKQYYSYNSLSDYSDQPEGFEAGLKVFYLFNLTHLTMGFKAPWHSLLPYLLECSPNLQMLRLVQVERCLCDPVKVNLEVLPKDSLSKLRVFEMEDFWDTEVECSLLKYILENGRALEAVRIQRKFTGPPPQKVLSLYGVSRTCKITYT